MISWHSDTKPVAPIYSFPVTDPVDLSFIERFRKHAHLRGAYPGWCILPTEQGYQVYHWGAWGFSAPHYPPRYTVAEIMAEQALPELTAQQCADIDARIEAETRRSAQEREDRRMIGKYVFCTDAARVGWEAMLKNERLDIAMEAA